MTTDVLTEVVGRAGVITLNRPRALNALTHDMVRAIAAALDAWRDDRRVGHVVIRQTGERAFCAGGDIRLIAEDIKAARFEAIDGFYRDEYRLNRTIKRYPKPYVALIDGIVMGGGVGVSVHGAWRVATERLVFAMPEVGIGFFPDVGATFFLPRLPGKIGLYLALTGARLQTADAVFAGLATHHVPSADLEALFEALTVAVDVRATIELFDKPAGKAPLAERRPALDRLLNGATLAEVLRRIRKAGEDDKDATALELAAVLATRSPTSVALAFEQIRRGAKLDFEECMRLEYRIVSRIVRGHDFVEGVRAVIVDKDNAPRWTPPTFEDLDGSEVALHLAPLAEELSFPGEAPVA